MSARTHISRRDRSRRNRCNKLDLRLPRPVRHERGEGRGEGLLIRAAALSSLGCLVPQASSPASSGGVSPPEPISRCERSGIHRRTDQRVRLPRPVRHERGEGRGEGCPTMASGPTVRSASAPRPSPPFRTEERESEAPVRTARTFAKTDSFSVRFALRVRMSPSRDGSPVAQTSKSAVSRVSKPAERPPIHSAPTDRTRSVPGSPRRFGNRRYSRFGNLRYIHRTPFFLLPTNSLNL